MPFLCCFHPKSKSIKHHPELIKMEAPAVCIVLFCDLKTNRVEKIITVVSRYLTCCLMLCNTEDLPLQTIK